MGERTASRAFGTPYRLLLVCVILQAAVLSWRLDLLPMWGDEQFTMATSAEQPARIVEIVAADYHPPLYYLLIHYWLKIPLHASPLAQARMLSVLFALLATFLLGRFWLRRLDASSRLWFLLLWVLSPCMLLYARMARAYTLQLVLICVAVGCLCRWMENPGDRRAVLLYALLNSVLLYVHYISGGVLLVAAVLVLLWKLRRRPRAALLPMTAGVGLVAASYVPWLLVAGDTFPRCARLEPYLLTGNSWAEHPVRVAYWLVSFSFGESLSLVAVLLSLALAPFLLWQMVRGLGEKQPWLAPVLVMAVVGYFGVAATVIFALVPARLLFLLPFYFLLLLDGRKGCASWK